MKKLLNNQWFVVVLGAVAAGVVVWNATSGMRRRNAKVVNPAAVAAAARQAALGAENAAKEKQAEVARQAAILVANGAAGAADLPTLSAVQFGVVPPFMEIDGAKVRVRLSEWLDTPARDPFARPPELVQKATNSPAVAFKLKGVWRQTGGGYAVINDTVVQEGDNYHGFIITRIVADAVILNSDQGPQRLELPAFAAPPPPTNRPPVGAAMHPRMGRL